MSANLVMDQLKNVKMQKFESKVDKFAKSCFLKLCGRFNIGHFTVKDGADVYEFGDGNDILKANIKIESPAFYSQILSHGENGLAEAYINGLWSTDNLTNVLLIGLRNQEATEKMGGWKSKLLSAVFRFNHERNKNSKDGSKRNILSHYDLGNSFFKEFLDSSMTYSCGIFESEQSTMEEASRRKIDLICQKLNLKPEDHLLEIGTGWGAFSIHAAKHYGCKVTTTTISDSQYDYALQQIKTAGLSERITILKKDYRDLTGTYDKLASVEMIEAVGHEYMSVFFKKCSKLLKPNGLMALQAITIQDQNYEQARKNADFIKRYIFPGSCLPSNYVMMKHLSNETDMNLRDMQDIGLDYARTLNIWQNTLKKNQANVKKLGMPDEFLRLWNYYFSYCQAGFLERHISTVQMIFAKPKYKESIKKND